MTSGDRSYRALSFWLGGGKDSERMCAQLASIEGYSSVDPTHPLGGPDGKCDAQLMLGDECKIMAVSFSREPVSFAETRKKILSDCSGISKNGANGIVFFCNQKLTKNERESLSADLPSDSTCEIYHLERIRQLLDRPECYGIRLEFLDIPMTKEDQLAYFAVKERDQLVEINRVIREQNSFLNNIITGGNSFPFAKFFKRERNSFNWLASVQCAGGHSLYDLEICQISRTSDYGKVQHLRTHCPVLHPSSCSIDLKLTQHKIESVNRERENALYLLTKARNGAFVQRTEVPDDPQRVESIGRTAIYRLNDNFSTTELFKADATSLVWKGDTNDLEGVLEFAKNA